MGYPAPGKSTPGRILKTCGGSPGAQWSVALAPPSRVGTRSATPTRTVPRVRAAGASRTAGPAPPSRASSPVRPARAAVRAVTVVVAIRAEGAAERRVQVLDRVGQDRLVAAPQNGKAERPIDGRKVTGPDPPGLPLAQPDAGHAGP